VRVEGDQRLARGTKDLPHLLRPQANLIEDALNRRPRVPRRRRDGALWLGARLVVRVRGLVRFLGHRGIMLQRSGGK